jgi:hypothetical protein
MNTLQILYEIFFCIMLTIRNTKTEWNYEFISDSCNAVKINTCWESTEVNRYIVQLLIHTSS